jgi:methylglutaconyl-CoA hydratase
MSESYLQIEIKGPVAEVTMQRPEVHNAFDDRMIAELTQCYNRLSDDRAVRIIVLRGAGKSFCSGAHLARMRQMADFSREENIADAQAMQRMFATIANCPKITVAAVHGPAIGGGVGLVAACDLAIAACDAWFALSEVRLGLIPAVIAPYVVEKIGIGWARTLFLTGERVVADSALRIGLVQHVVSTFGSIDQAKCFNNGVQHQIEPMLAAAPTAAATAKRLLRQIAGLTPDQAAETTIECIASLRVSPEGQEGIRAFLEKRKPNWIEKP